MSIQTNLTLFQCDQCGTLAFKTTGQGLPDNFTYAHLGTYGVDYRLAHFCSQACLETAAPIPARRK